MSICRKVSGAVAAGALVAAVLMLPGQGATCHDLAPASSVDSGATSVAMVQGPLAGADAAGSAAARLSSRVVPGNTGAPLHV